MRVASGFETDAHWQAVFLQNRDQPREVVCAIGDRQPRWRALPTQGGRFNFVRFDGLNLFGANFNNTEIFGASLVGADLGGADLQSVEWLGASLKASPSHFTDFRGGTGLTQALLSSLIGDERTLLPDRPDPDTGELPFAPSCWRVEPDCWDILVKALSEKGDGRDLSRQTMTEEQMRDEFLCPAGQLPRKTGTPWPLGRDLPLVFSSDRDRSPVC